MGEHKPEPRDQEPRSLEDWLRQFFTDSTLRPVVFVAAGCFAAIGAGVLLAALYGRNLPAIGALVLLGLMSADVLIRDRRRNRRLGILSRVVLGFWALSVVAAVGAVALGLA